VSYLNDAELTVMRADLYTTLPDVGWIESVTHTSDGAGGYTESWAAVSWTPARTGSAGTVAPYRLDPLDVRSQIELIASGEAKEVHYILIVEWDAPISAGTAARFVDKNSRVLNIRRLAPDNSWRILKRCFVAEVV
jgi:hypothetical protein